MRRARRGFGVLVAVCALAFAASLMVFALQSLSRSSGRNLVALEEHRQLTDLCRSAVSEALYKMQVRLEQGDSRWVDFCTQLDAPADRTVALTFTTTFAGGMVGDDRLLKYTVSDVTVHRDAGVTRGAGMSGQAGAVDFTVTATVERHRPTHAARLVLTVRHAFWFSDAPTPFPNAGRHIELMPTPVATLMRVE